MKPISLANSGAFSLNGKVNTFRTTNSALPIVSLSCRKTSSSNALHVQFEQKRAAKMFRSEQAV